MPSHVNLPVLCVWIAGCFMLVTAFPWVHPSLEKLDELNDAEIYKAVVSSVTDWQRKQEQKKISNRLKREDILSACYPDLGCFEASGPFGYLDTLPANPEEINTKFLMYPGRRMRKSGSPPAEVPFEKLTEAFEWAKQGFNSSLPTKVLIHGFGSGCSYIWVYEIRSALMAVEEANIICVDWSNGASIPNYVKASANTRLVGKQLSLLLRGLVEKNGLSLKKTHLIGFSLGAHIAAFAGADLGNLSRITGLDPAGPLFESQDPRARLDQTDADFVDVIHSNGENLILGGLGSSQPMGHVDFYPNGGRMQKGCSHLFVGAVSDIIWSSPVEGRSLCNHRRAYKFFIDSVSPRCHFPAFPCNSYEEFLDGKCFPCTDERKCGNMGYYADRSKGRGQLYLITRDEEPFCAHQYHVKIETTSSPIPVKSYGKIQITLIGENSLNETFTMTKKDDEEMKLGQSISRILVPHPILSQLTTVEILYTAYSGWLSSGLTQWKMDKVTLMDSFGKTSSVCKKNLILESGIPVILPLYPGECNLPKTNEAEAEDRMQHEEETNPFNVTEKKPEFIPTQVVKVGLEDKYLKMDQSASPSETLDFYNLPWTNVKENDLIDEAESSRAFNTRVVKPGRLEKSDRNGLLKEIVEPILRPHSTKNARSHDPDRDKPEITEPILGPTTTKSLPKLTKNPEVEFKSKNKKLAEDSKHAFYDAPDSSDWVPKDIPIKPKVETKRKREDESRILNIANTPSRNDPIEAIATTVQFLPQRIARMFEDAEKYARENIFPLVSTYTPRFITDIIVPKERRPKYIPLQYKEPTADGPTSGKVVELGRKLDLQPDLLGSASNDVTTPFTYIQKIKKKGAKTSKDVLVPVTSVIAQYKEEETRPSSTTLSPSKEVSRKARDDMNVQPKRKSDPLEMIINTVQDIPENIGKMFQQAERFTRENVLPFVNNLTPKFITDIFSPKELPRFIPFSSEESLGESPMNLSGVKRNKRNRNAKEIPQESTTYSHIQKIAKRGFKTKSN